MNTDGIHSVMKSPMKLNTLLLFLKNEFIEMKRQCKKKAPEKTAAVKAICWVIRIQNTHPCVSSGISKLSSLFELC